MRSKLVIYITTIGMAVSCLSSSAQVGFVPYDPDYISERQQAYTVSSTSSEDLNAIPVYEVYRTIFLRILGNPALFNQLSSADARIALALPDHNDAQFHSPLQRDLRAACKKIDEQQYLMATGELVEIFVGADSVSERRLIQHYKTVLRRLSDDANRLVDAQIRLLSENDSLSYSKTDYVGFSREFPEFMRSKLFDGCNKVVNDYNTLKQKLLTDNFIHRNDFQIDD